MDAAAALYRDKERGYFNYPRLDLLEMLPAGAGLKILELGAGDGATLRAAKARGIASYAVGIDLVAIPAGPDAPPGPAAPADPAHPAAQPGPPGLPPIDRFLVGNVEQ